MKSTILNTAAQADFVARCCELVKARQGRMTKARKVVFESLSQASSPLGAYEILETARKRVASLDAATVYRSIELLESEGLIHESNDARWIPCSHFSEHRNSVHVISRCQCCDTLSEQCVENSEALQKVLKFSNKKSDFEPRLIHVFGLCRKCQSK